MAADNVEAVHLWTSDSDGCVHVLFNAFCSGDDVSMKWREGDGSQTSVVCSNRFVGGIGLTDSCLALRTGVAYDSPMGKKWSLSSQSVKKLAIGSKYLAILTNDGRTLTCVVPGTIVRDVTELDFSEISSPPKDIVHIIMDSKDVVYSITLFGEVQVCRGVGGENSPLKWEFFSKPPSLARRGGFLSSLFASKKPLFIDVAVFDEQMFFLRADPQEIWQLVVTEILFGSKTQYRSSWNCFKFKARSQKLSLIASNPMNNNELFGVSEDGNALLRLDLQGKSITISEMPFHGCGDITITSLSACHLTQDSIVPKIYPKLPKLDVCCENGECTFCQGKIVIIDMEDEDWERKYKDELSLSIAKWRRGQEYHLPKVIHLPSQTEEKRSTRKRRRATDETPYLTQGIEESPPSKRPTRPHVCQNDIPKRSLIEGIEVVIKTDSLYYSQNLQKFNVDSIFVDNEEINYSFYLEEQVVNSNGEFRYPEPQTSMETESHTGIQAESQAESQTGTTDHTDQGELVIINNKCSPDITRYYTCTSKTKL